MKEKQKRVQLCVYRAKRMERLVTKKKPPALDKRHSTVLLSTVEHPHSIFCQEEV